MRILRFTKILLLLSLTGCPDKKPEEPEKPAEPAKKEETKPLTFSIRNETNELEQVLRIDANGDLYHRGKKITSDDRIIAALYDLIISSDATLNRCLTKLALYRQDQVSGLMKRVVEAENKAITGDKPKAKAEASSAVGESNIKKEK